MTQVGLDSPVEEPPNESVDAAGMPLACTKDPMVEALEAALMDDEPYTEDDRLMSDEGWAAYQRGEAVKLA